MVARSAYAQLRYSRRSSWLACSPALGVTYLAPPLIALFGARLAPGLLGLAAWLLMAIAFQPTLRFLPGPRRSGGSPCRPLLSVTHAVYPSISALQFLARQRRPVEGPCPG